jgi:hypothetical protein
MASIQRVATAGLQRPSNYCQLLHSKRSFFASSTDYTRLLKEAEVFRFQENSGWLYVMAAGGSEESTVIKVPQLHLARLHLDAKENIVWGAKVVNRTLGSPQHVCGKLVDAARKDMENALEPARAKSVLHGLSEWVLTNALKAPQTINGLQGISPSTVEALSAVARNQSNTNLYEQNKQFWELLARAFLKDLDASKIGEAALYQSKGATLVEIIHQSDTSEFSDTCAGAMAMLKF